MILEEIIFSNSFIISLILMVVIFEFTFIFSRYIKYKKAEKNDLNDKQDNYPTDYYENYDNSTGDENENSLNDNKEERRFFSRKDIMIINYSTTVIFVIDFIIHLIIKLIMR